MDIIMEIIVIFFRLAYLLKTENNSEGCFKYVEIVDFKRVGSIDW